MASPKLDNPNEVSRSILNPTGDIPQNFILTLSQFKTVYQAIYKNHGNTRVDIVLNGDWALIQFSELCNHRIRVLPDNLFHRFRKALNIRLYLEKDDFEIAYSSAKFYGQEKYINTRRFLKEEIQVNGFRSLVILFFSGLLLSLINSQESVKAANELLIGVASIFFSIFLLFTVSQNLPELKVSLFKSGLTHRFVQIDAKVTYQVIVVIGVAFINLVLAENANITQIGLQIITWSTAFGIALIGTSFFTVVQYYFSRAKALYETEMSKKVLDAAFEEAND